MKGWTSCCLFISLFLLSGPCHEGHIQRDVSAPLLGLMCRSRHFSPSLTLGRAGKGVSSGADAPTALSRYNFLERASLMRGAKRKPSNDARANTCSVLPPVSV